MLGATELSIIPKDTHMKYSKSEAARRIGYNRKTLDKHIKTKGITVEQDLNGNPQIDASELIRVYGDRFRPEGTTQQTPEEGATNTPTVPTPNAEIQVAVLKKEVELLEQQRDQFKDLYEEERAERQGSQKLLTDQREKQNAWERSFEELKQQIADQDYNAKRELARFKEKADQEMLRYRRALVVERNKGFMERLLGRRKGKSK